MPPAQANGAVAVPPGLRRAVDVLRGVALRPAVFTAAVEFTPPQRAVLNAALTAVRQTRECVG
eukprot:1640905-Lingulodinium_polyedra.AAC.1